MARRLWYFGSILLAFVAVGLPLASKLDSMSPFFNEARWWASYILLAWKKFSYAFRADESALCFALESKRSSYPYAPAELLYSGRCGDVCNKEIPKAYKLFREMFAIQIDETNSSSPEALLRSAQSLKSCNTSNCPCEMFQTAATCTKE